LLTLAVAVFLTLLALFAVYLIIDAMIDEAKKRIAAMKPRAESYFEEIDV
jgi:hypothetical protein